MKVSLLKQDQIFGKNVLNAIKIFGRKVGATDLAVLQGAYINSDGITDSTGNCSADTWTSSEGNISGRNGFVACVSQNGDESTMKPTNMHGLFRPILILEPKELSNFKNAKEVKVSGGQSFGKLAVYEFGRYPQKIVDRETAERLEKLLTDHVETTEHSYTFNKSNIWKSEIPEFRAYTCREYEYNGDKYIRLFGEPAKDTCVTANQKHIDYGKIYWVKVEPIRWLFDQEKNMLISEQGLLSGIPFTNSKNYNGNFEKTIAYRYLNTYFINEIVDVRRLCRAKTIIPPRIEQYER